MATILHHSPILSDRKIAATIGMFDGVHVGHSNIIDDLKREAEARNMDSGVITFRNHPQLMLRPDSDLRLIMPIEKRLHHLSKLGLDYIILFDFTEEIASLSAFQFIKMLRDNYNVRFLMIGFNHRFGHNRTDGFEEYVRFGEQLGVEVKQSVEIKKDNHHVSSSTIRKLIKGGDMQQATALMGKTHELSGVVVHGFANGRKIGFPTANMDCDPNIIVPANGVYAVKVMLDNGETHGGVCNIGFRPTLDNGKNLTIEVNIFNFSADIYDKTITIAFIQKLRDERKMNSLDELKSQIEIDKKKAELIIGEQDALSQINI